MRKRVPRPAKLLTLLMAPACALLIMGAAMPAAQASGPTAPSSDPFYTYTGSTPLADIAPGTVLAKRSVSLELSGLTVPVSTEQVLYRTTGELGQATATVTTIIHPLIPLEGRDILAYQPAYDALGSECDPSYELQGGNGGIGAEGDAIAAYIIAGFTVTVPDYEGENLDWAAGQEEGYNTLDAIRATENYEGDSSSTKVGMFGYSGGAIATQWASELQPSYAPSLHIIGAASGGIPVDLAHNLTYINGTDDWSGVIPAVLVSLGRAFGINITPYLSAYGEQITSAVSGECIGSFASAYPGMTIQQLLGPNYQNPFDIGPLVTVLNDLIMGTAGTPTEPQLLGAGDVDGTGDNIMVVADEEALGHLYCTEGVSTTFDLIPGLDHQDAAIPFEVTALAFLENLFNGGSSSNNCSSIPNGNSLAPLPVPSS
jgi:Secretory lipase